MQDSEDNQSPDHKPCDGTAQGAGQNATPGKSGRFNDIFDVAGGIICTAAAAACFDNGFHKVGLIFIFSAIVFGLIIIRHHVEKTGFEYTNQCFWIFLALAALLLGSLVLKTPELKPHPDFSFCMCLGDTYDDAIELTNDFLIVTNFDKYTTMGALCLPMKTGESNAMLSFLIKNNSSELAEKVEVTVFLTKNLVCLPSSGWLQSKSKTSFTHSDSLGKLQTDKVQSWMFPLAVDLLPGNGNWLPILQVSATDINAEWGELDIMARAKDCPAKIISFSLCFLPNQVKNIKPLVLLAKEIPNVGEVIIVPPEK
jgi:hypothetical protein